MLQRSWRSRRGWCVPACRSAPAWRRTPGTGACRGRAWMTATRAARGWSGARSAPPSGTCPKQVSAALLPAPLCMPSCQRRARRASSLWASAHGTGGIAHFHIAPYSSPRLVVNFCLVLVFFLTFALSSGRCLKAFRPLWVAIETFKGQWRQRKNCKFLIKQKWQTCAGSNSLSFPFFFFFHLLWFFPLIE